MAGDKQGCLGCWAVGKEEGLILTLSGHLPRLGLLQAMLGISYGPGRWGWGSSHSQDSEGFGAQ